MKTTVEQIREIFELVMKINGTEEKRATKGEPCAFLEIDGHVAGIRVAVHEKGWAEKEPFVYPDKRFNLALDGGYGDDPEECIKYLKSLLKEAGNEK